MKQGKIQRLYFKKIKNGKRKTKQEIYIYIIGKQGKKINWSIAHE